MKRRRQYDGYPLGRIIIGITMIRNRRGHRADDIHYYLLTFGFNDVSEFENHLARRTCPRFARDVIRGRFPAQHERRARRRRAREYREWLETSTNQ